MKRLLTVLLFVTTSVCALIFAMGQDFKSLKDKAENAVKSRRPDWKIKSKHEKEKEVYYNWNSRQDGATLTIFHGDTEQEAAERMQLTLKFLAVGPGKKRSDLGDEAYSWKSERSGFAGIRFRKGNVYVDLAATSEQMAEDLAKDLEKFIKKN
ncbi:MAG TPA: hypothetical protein VFO99_19705 [Pyrinomonadaceae bacterium]|nr:hypothetical protein [Pyrinomonadaceae bacterium]